MAKEKVTQCESCAYYEYDDDCECYICTVNFDQDDYAAYSGGGASCPYYSFYDEYAIVRKQN